MKKKDCVLSDRSGSEKGVNCHEQVVKEFGQEWSVFDHSGADTGELKRIFNLYFSVFPWEKLGKNGHIQGST
jgi:hypothetical protein